MSTKHMQLCRNALESWPRFDQALRPNTPVLAVVKAHPPELILALWECYEDICKPCAEEDDTTRKLVARVEELTNE